MTRRQERAQRKALEAAVSIVLLGAALLLVPLIFSRTSPFGRAFAPLWPLALLFMAVGAAIFSVRLRATKSSDQRGMATRRKRTPTAAAAPSVEPRPDDLTAIREHTRDNRPTSPDPTTWSAAVFDVIEWRRFEAVVEALFSQAGFITKSETHGADGGVDVWLYSKHQPDDKPVSIVQCKHWSGKRVGVDKIRELRGVMAAHGVARGQFATTSAFTPDAVEFAARNGIHLLDTTSLLALIDTRSAEQQRELLAVALEGDYRRPTCVNCGVKMIERTPKSGGRAFWGCSGFPSCRTTLPMRASALGH